MVHCRFSAPGKVLITGGYLVLDQKYSGLVITTDARFYSSCYSSSKESSSGSFKITVNSPQFLNSSRVYSVDGFVITNSLDQPANPFIETCLQLCLCFAQQSLANDVNITIEADNAFYSQASSLDKLNLPLERKYLLQLPPRNKLGCEISQAFKTGLGSSAALVTSLTAAFLSYLLPNSIDISEPTCANVIHNLAQIAHSFAQGKIGSGFDISSAVYGSQLYSRFSPSIIDGMTPDRIDYSVLQEVCNSRFVPRLYKYGRRFSNIQVSCVGGISA